MTESLSVHDLAVGQRYRHPHATNPHTVWTRDDGDYDAVTPEPVELVPTTHVLDRIDRCTNSAVAHCSCGWTSPKVNDNRTARMGFMAHHRTEEVPS